MALRDKSRESLGRGRIHRGPRLRESRVMAELTRAELKGGNLGKEGKGRRQKKTGERTLNEPEKKT